MISRAPEREHRGTARGRARRASFDRSMHLLLFGLVITSLGGLSGCGHVLYASKVNSAATRLEEARELGAEELAPYEYWLAKEHLDKARREAAEADYGDAMDLADESEAYAEKAVQLSREAHRGAGR